MYKTALYNLIINLLLMAVAIISVGELILSKSTSRFFFRRISGKGWLLIIFSLSSVVFNFHKDLISTGEQILAEQAKDKSDSTFKALQLSIKDSIKIAIDSTYTKSLKASNEALAKYSLVISDSLHSVSRGISKLKLDAVHPQLAVCAANPGTSPIYLQKDTTGNYVCFQFESKGGTSYNIFLDFYLIYEGEFRTEILIFQPLPLNFILEGRITTQKILIPASILTYGNLVIYFTGTFSKDPEGKLILPYNEAFIFNFKDSKFTKFSANFDELKKRVLSFPLPK